LSASAFRAPLSKPKKIIAARKQTGAQAVQLATVFLSENAGFLKVG
jgi:acetyl/propionyl-CoA carboxylase alpha subunit